MKKLILSLLCASVSALAAQPAPSAPSVLIVADEFPAMEILAGKLRASENIESKIVKQTEMPKDLAAFRAVIVYIHGDMRAPAEKAFINYTQAGGKLILLHHSISSGKRKNQLWIPFTAVNLPYGEFKDGGYHWIDPVTLDIVNLAPLHYITTHNVKFPLSITYNSSTLGGGERKYPGFTLPETEVYLNHVLTGERTVLLGLKYKEAATGRTYMQDTAGWVQPSGKGCIVYLMAGHSVKEFEHPIYLQLVLNAVTFKP